MIDLIDSANCGKSKYPDAGLPRSSRKPSAQIVGGIDARPYEFPWQVGEKFLPT